MDTYVKQLKDIIGGLTAILIAAIGLFVIVRVVFGADAVAKFDVASDMQVAPVVFARDAQKLITAIGNDGELLVCILVTLVHDLHFARGGRELHDCLLVDPSSDSQNGIVALAQHLERRIQPTLNAHRAVLQDLPAAKQAVPRHAHVPNLARVFDCHENTLSVGDFECRDICCAAVLDFKARSQ